ncbi:MAG: tetratricopeptide repeat protein [Methanomassiliicoccales archaeon PtaB.Bin215]|nr:MAG: tetratricopeptide repeat protein [Methanomassiliicoccales archaeon PtaB.Bin215]
MPVTDLSEKLDQNERQRLLEAVRSLGAQEYRDLMISLMGGMGVRVQSAREQHGALVIHGQGEVPYLVIASRTGFADPELVVRSLVEDAKSDGRVPVFMSLQELDPGTLNLLEKEEVSFADAGRFVNLLQKYGLDEQLTVKEDLKVLEDRGEPCLPSVCKLEELLEEAEQRRRKGDRSGAVRVLDQALQIKPLNDSIWLKKASYLLEMGRGADALAAANKAAELRPGDAGTWFTIALIQDQLGDRERELAAYDNVLRINPAHAPAMLNKGATLYEMGRLEWSLKVFNDIVHHYPQEPRGWNNRGLALKGMGKLLEAQASFEKAHALDPEFEDPLINLARMREERGDMPGAVEGWKDVLRLVDSRADIWAHLGTCLRANGEHEDALTAFDRALTLEPELEQVRRERDELAAQVRADEGPEPAQEGAASGATVPEAESQVPPEETVPVEGSGQAASENVALEQVGERLPAELSQDVSLQVREDEVSLEKVPEPLPPAELPAEIALAVKEEPGMLEEVPKALPVQFQSGPLAVEPPVDLTATLKEPSEDKEASGDAGSIEPEAPVAPEWPYEVRLPPLSAEPEGRSMQEAALLLAGKEYGKAVEICDQALKEGPDIELLRLKARALISLNRGEEAAEALKEALRHSPGDARTSLDLEAMFHRYGGEGGKLLQSLDCQESRSRHALELLERQRYNELARMDVKKGGLPLRLSKSLALVRLGRYREASKLLKSLISEFPAYPEGLSNLGVCMRFMGEYDYDQAIHLMKLALEVDPHHSDAMNNIGCTLFAAGKYEEAVEVFKAAADEDRRPEYLLNLSNVQMALGDTSSAKESLTSALKMEESADVLYMLAVIAESEKQFKWALSLYQDALTKSPGFREAQTGVDRTKVLAKK